MTRVFVDAGNVIDHKIIIDNQEDIHHITKVMRLKEGDEVEVSDSVQWEYICRLVDVQKSRIEAHILDKRSFSREPELKVTVFQGIPKAGKMETIIQKCTELGVHAIVPVWNKRTVVADKGNFTKKIDRWQKVANEAAKQCKRGKVPAIANDLQFQDMVANLAQYDLVVFPYENEEEKSIKDLLSSIAKKPAHVAVIIGPEGGFSQEEVDLVCKTGCAAVTLGKTILRTETAGPATLAMVMYALEL